MGKTSFEPIMVSVCLNGQKLQMEVDTSAAFSIISEATRQAVFLNQTLHPADLVLKTYTDEFMKVKVTLNMRVKYHDQKQKFVVSCSRRKWSYSPWQKLAKVPPT